MESMFYYFLPEPPVGHFQSYYCSSWTKSCPDTHSCRSSPCNCDTGARQEAANVSFPRYRRETSFQHSFMLLSILRVSKVMHPPTLSHHSALLHSITLFTRNPLQSIRSKKSKWQVFSAVQPSNQNRNQHPPTNDSSITLKKFSQLWAIILPVGYGFIPIITQGITSALQPTLGSQQAAQATAALLGESLILIIIPRVIETNNYTFIPSKPSQFSCGIAAGISSLAIALLLPPLLDISSTTTTTTTTTVHPIATTLTSVENPLFLLPLFISTSILAPIIEEMVYRGYLQHRLVNIHNYSPISAVLVSAAAFSFGHLQQSSFGLFQLFIIGIAFGVTYQLTQGGGGGSGGGRGGEVEAKGGSDISTLYSGDKNEDMVENSSSSSRNGKNNYVGASVVAHVVYNTALFTDAASNGIWPV